MLVGYSSFPIATAVSDMRLEKPHSLSYHAITRTSVPFSHLGLVHVEGGRVRVVVEVDRDIRRGSVAEDRFELLLGVRASSPR